MHLLFKLSTRKINLKLLEKQEAKIKVKYNPDTQCSEILMGGFSTSCHKSTQGTQPKNEADRVMDDF